MEKQYTRLLHMRVVCGTITPLELIVFDRRDDLLGHLRHLIYLKLSLSYLNQG